MTQDTSLSLSIVMPVHDTGPLLLEAVRSVVAQSAIRSGELVDWELIIVNDASSDAATLSALREAAGWSPHIRVLKNTRARGPAGARNTGIFEARGEWIGFLDSDDVWYPDFLRAQGAAFPDRRAMQWCAAHFHVGDAHAIANEAPLEARSPYLYGQIAEDYDAGRTTRLPTPVRTLLVGGCLQVMTVQVRRVLLQRLGGFDETLRSAEDFDLWLRLASAHDLFLAPIDAGVYRTRPGSLTHAARPMYYCEDRMLTALLRQPAFEPYRRELDDRLHMVYTKFCFDYRARRRYLNAATFAVRLITKRPFAREGWRHLTATCLLR